MKKTYTIFLLFICVCSYSQTMTEKYNSILGRYEYFDSQGNLTGYKLYDSLFKEWKYYKVDATAYERKPIQYAPPPKDDNFALLQQVANQKQSSYNINHKKVQECLYPIQAVINAESNSELKQKLQNRFNSEILAIINNGGYDYSNSSVTNQVIDFIYKKSTEIFTNENKKHTEEIENGNENENENEIGYTTPYSNKKLLSDNLIKYLGTHNTYKIEEYTKKSDGKWGLTNIDLEAAEIILNHYNQIWWKRSAQKKYTGRNLISLKNIDSKGYYIYETDGGDTLIEKDFKIVIFYDKYDTSKKYLYYIQKQIHLSNFNFKTETNINEGLKKAFVHFKPFTRISNKKKFSNIY